MTLLALLLAAQVSNVPELPDDVPRSATLYDVLLVEKQAGQMAVWNTPDGKLRVFFQFNDRGRGPRTYSTYTLQGGLPVAVEVEGNDYMKDPVHESFETKNGASSWKNKAEHGSRTVTGPAFYPSMFGAPLESALLITAALQNHGAISLLPEGEARVRKIATRPEATLYAVTGLDFAPNYLWLDAQARLFAIWSGWFTLVRAGKEAAMPALIQAQKKVMSELEQDRVRRLQHRPQGKLLVHDAGVFDAESARVEPHRDVLVEGNRILSVTPAQAEVVSGVEVIDGRGKMLLPGLWDMHAHVADNDGLLNLAAGVTTVRDLANDNDELAARIARIEKGEEIGTRVVRAGFIDGPGPYQGPTKVLVATKEEALKWVDWYADHGFVQIKLYSSVKPELLPVVAEEAHRRGLRLSGHVPSGMLAAQAVREGYDEIQHLNFLLLNFMPDVIETRTPARFLEPARRGADLDVSSPAVREFIALLKDPSGGLSSCGRWLRPPRLRFSPAKRLCQSTRMSFARLAPFIALLACGHAGTQIATLPVASNPGSWPTPLAVDSANVYAAPSDVAATALSVFAVPLAGGAPVQLIGNRHVQAIAVSMALDERNLYLAARDFTGGSNTNGSSLIWRLPKAGGQDPVLLAQANGVSSLATDGQLVYWAGSDGIQAAPADGSGSARTLLADSFHVTSMALDGSSIFYIHLPVGAVQTLSVRLMPKLGGGWQEIATLPASQSTWNFDIAAGATDLFFDAAEQADRIYSVPKTGGAPTQLAGLARLLSLAADGAQVFWTSQSVSGNGSQITAHGGALAGGTPGHTGTVSSSGAWFSRVALDSKFAYWIEDRALYRVAR